MITLGQIEAATEATRNLTDEQAEGLRPLVNLLATWSPMNFADTVDVNYRRAARETRQTAIGERLAEALLAGKLQEAIDCEIASLNPADLAGFRRSAKYGGILLTAA